MKFKILFLLVMAINLCGNEIVQVDINTTVAIQNITAEDAQHIAIQRARASAIDEALGVSITRSSLLSNGSLVADFVKSYSRGYIVEETIEWFPLSQFQKDEKTPPIPVYSLNLKAKVKKNKLKQAPLCQSELNKGEFYENDTLTLMIKCNADTHIGIFNIRADDKVDIITPVIPNEKPYFVAAGDTVFLPERNSGYEFRMSLLPGRKQVAEAIYIIYTSDSTLFNYFLSNQYSSVANFFKTIASLDIAYSDEVLSYSVKSKK